MLQLAARLARWAQARSRRNTKKSSFFFAVIFGRSAFGCQLMFRIGKFVRAGGL